MKINKIQEPCVLILVPTLNEELWINRCIESVCRQTYNNWIIYCQDNVSTDLTFSRVESIASKWTNVFANKLDKQVSGADSFNLVAENGLKMFKSEYICWLGADDYWQEADYLERMIKKLKQNQAIAVSPNVQLISEDDSNIAVPFNPSFENPIKIIRVGHLLQNWNGVNALYGIYARDAFQEIFQNGGPVSEYNGSDWWWVYAAIIKGKIINCERATYRKTIWSTNRRQMEFLGTYESFPRKTIRNKIYNVLYSWKSDISPFYRHILGERQRLLKLNDWTLLVVIAFFAFRSLINIPYSPIALVIRKIRIFIRNR